MIPLFFSFIVPFGFTPFFLDVTFESVWDNQWEQMQIRYDQWEHMIFFVGKDAVTGLSVGTYDVMVFSLGTYSVTDSVPDEDTRSLQKHYLVFDSFFIYPRKKIFIHVKKFWISTIRHLVIFTYLFIIYYSLYNSLDNIVLNVPFCP